MINLSILKDGDKGDKGVLNKKETKKTIIFFFVSFLLAILALLLLNSKNIENSIIAICIYSFSLIFALIWTVFISRKIIIVILPFLIFISGIILSENNSEIWRSIFFALFFALSYLFPLLLFFKNYQEKIKLSLFLDGKNAIKSGFSLAIISCFLFLVGTNISFQNISEKFIHSEYYEIILLELSKSEKIQEIGKNSLEEQTQILCKESPNKKECIAQIQNESSVNFEEQIKESLDTSFKSFFIQISTMQEKKEEVLLYENNNYFSFIPSEYILNISLLLLALFILSPFSLLFSFILSFIFVFIIFILQKTGILHFEKIIIKKEIII